MIYLIIGSGLAFAYALLTAGDDDDENEPDLPPSQGSTRYKRVDQILDSLRAASASSGVPLGVLVGWVAVESGGRIELEGGLFRLSADEVKAIGCDRARLSSDLVYSVNAGLMLIAHYMRVADELAVAARGTPYYWLLVHLCHVLGEKECRAVVSAAKHAGETRAWDKLGTYAAQVNPSTSKAFARADKARATGEGFGFGQADVVVGGAAYSDITDPLDELQK